MVINRHEVVISHKACNERNWKRGYTHIASQNLAFYANINPSKDSKSLYGVEVIKITIMFLIAP